MADTAGRKGACARSGRGRGGADMDEADLRAFKPIEFSEFAPRTKLNINFCRNPMCPNFGPAPDLASYAERYKVEPMPGYLAERRYQCRACEMYSRLLSNRSLRAAYVWFKRQSVPFAACRTAGCANEGVNVFEHSGSYTQHSEDVAKCKCCGRKFALGEAEHLKDWAKQKKRLAGIYDQLTDEGKGVRAMARKFRDRKFDVHRYQTAAAVLARRLRDYQGYCNAELMAPGYQDRLDGLFAQAGGTGEPGSPFDGTAALSTDAMKVTLRAPGENFPGRQHHLDILLTALRIAEPDKTVGRKSRVFLLAAHPVWLHRSAGPFPETAACAVADAALPVARRQFDHLQHYGTDHSENKWLNGQLQSYLGGSQGLYMRPEYASLAHFMVVKELTAGFDRVMLTMDGDRMNYRSAVAVFAEKLRTPCKRNDALRRAEIAVMQVEAANKPNKSARPRSKGWTAENRRVPKDWERRLGEEEDRRAGKPGAKAELFRKAMKGGWSDNGGWVWLERTSRDAGRVIVLWLSQGPDRDWPPDGEISRFLRETSLQSVDTAISAMRRRAAPLSRPSHRAEGGTGLYHTSENVEFAATGLWLSWFAFNYDNFYADENGLLPAPGLLGLLCPEDRRGFKLSRHLDFRLGWRHARELTQRLGGG